jgi:hypothetical protein
MSWYDINVYFTIYIWQIELRTVQILNIRSSL